MDYKIKIEKEGSSTNKYISLSQDRGIFKVEAEVDLCYYEYDKFPGLFDRSVHGVSLYYYFENKMVQRLGFKELYEKLFGENSFKEFETELEIEFEQAAFEHYSKEYRTVDNISCEEAENYLETHLKNNPHLVNEAYCEDTKKRYVYTSNRFILELCKHHDMYSVKKLKVPHSCNIKTDPIKHNVVVLENK